MHSLYRQDVGLGSVFQDVVSNLVRFQQCYLLTLGYLSVVWGHTPHKYGCLRAVTTDIIATYSLIYQFIANLIHILLIYAGRSFHSLIGRSLDR